MPLDEPQCLLVVDLQAAFVEGDAALPASDELLLAVGVQVAAAREAGALVVHVQNDGAAGTPDEQGTPGWELVMSVDPGDVVIRKSQDSAFTDTRLHAVLQSHRVTAISICGLQSEMCVAATARSALELGYSVVLAHDGHATYPVPAFAEGEAAVPAALASRAAEWSLGDGVAILATGAEICFVRS